MEEAGLDECMEVGLSREDALCQSKWIVDVNLTATRMRRIWPLSIVGDSNGFEAWVSLSMKFC